MDIRKRYSVESFDASCLVENFRRENSMIFGFLMYGVIAVLYLALIVLGIRVSFAVLSMDKSLKRIADRMDPFE